MDNCEKLLRAFIKAQGYEIEQTGGRTGNVASPVDYKVTNKGPTQQQKDSFSMSELIAHSDAWNAICDYVLFHKEDIESGINDFGDLKPVWNFFNRNTEPFTLEDIKHNFGEIDENIRYGNL